jgi:molybdopterin-guanine dinucleotide biosynthesis protein A
MTVLGAIFAGGAARRFGSDKAAAPIGGMSMIDRVAERLGPQCDVLVVVGREWPGLISIADAPRAGLGPLGALAGALEYARTGGHGSVLTSGCDLPDLPLDLAKLLRPGPAVVKGQPLLGLWPAGLGPPLVSWLASGGDQAIRSWIEHIGARRVALPVQPTNINRVEDLDRFIRYGGRGPAITPPADR